jgi:phage tail-like protein
MAEFSVKFRIKWDCRYVAGVSKISELRRSTEVTQHREGGDPSSHKSSGQIAFSPTALNCG